MPGNVKWYCTECGWAAKGRCPRHPESSLNMGKQWRPGKKGRKTRLWDNRVHGSVAAAPPRSSQTSRRPLYQRATPFKISHSPPPGLILLGATDFSRAKPDGSSFWRDNDPVRRAIRERNMKPSLEHRLKLPSKEPGWPFPYHCG
jgi:hypothetical protein